MLGAGKNTIEIILAARDRTRGAFVKVQAQMKGLEGVGSKLTKTFKNVAKAGAAIGAAAVIAGIAGSTKAFMDFEDAMANVRKTTGFTKEQIGVLGDAINDMALRIPVAQTELAGIAAVAGQLGITGQKNILDFTETAAKMSTAFDMSAESVAIAAAKLSNIYDIPIEQVSNLGSAINALGNTTAASESQILDFSMALGASAKMLGFGETEAVAMGASLVSMGMDASAAGTRLNSAFTQMGKNVDKVSKLLDISEEQFKAGFGEDPMNMLIRIITKLGEIKDPLERNTMAAETFGLIGAKAIVNLGANVDGLKTNLKTSATEFENNTSLTGEFAAKTDTLKAKFQLLKNSITSLLIDIGGELAPSIQTIIDGFKSILPAVKEVLYEVGAGFKEMFESISRQAGPALEPFTKKVKEAGEKLTEGFDFKTILDDIGVFIGAGLKPLIAALGWVIDKLGPLWDAINAVGKAFHFFADELRTADGLLDNHLDNLERIKGVMRDVDAMTASLEASFSTSAAIFKEWQMAVDAFTKGTGSAQDAIAAIDKEIEKQRDLWKIASDEKKEYIEETIHILEREKSGLEALERAAVAHLDTVQEQTDKAIAKTKEFIVTIGNTTIEFKGAAAEVVKNADAYAKLQDSAQTLIDLDWSVFTEFEASLPNIEAGLGDLESSFVGFKDILEENMDALENVQQSILDINEIAAPFIAEGFLEGIKAIGIFAGSLKDAGSAINDFSSLQDVSIGGCINFSLHVRDMVSALQILEGQMEDLVPAFGDMNLLIEDIKTGFLSGIDITALYGAEWDELQKHLKGVSLDWEYTYKAHAAYYGLTVEQIKLLRKEGTLATFAFMKHTSALRTQTEQLSKITEALQPYLNFMRTLNELATLSTLSTEELNAGLNSINDTLVNLGTALSGFDLRSAMEGLFAPAGTAGSARGFMDTMEAYQTEFNEVIKYTIRLTTSITDLVVAFDLLADIGDSVLSDQTKLKGVFEDIASVMFNFAESMSEMAPYFAMGMDAMITSAGPLSAYFEKNNAVVIKFNNTLGTFKTTITHVVDVMDMLRKMSEMVLPPIDELEVGFDKAAEAVLRFDEALLKHLGISREGYAEGMFKVIDEEAFASNIITVVSQFADSWTLIEKAAGDSFDTFKDGATTITELINSIVSLASAFESMKDIAIPGATEMGAVFDEIGKGITEFTEVVRTKFPAITPLLVTFDEEWQKHKGTIDDTLPSLKEAINAYSTLISLAISLTSAYDSLAVKEDELAKIRVISAENLAIAIKDIPEIIGEIIGLLDEPVWAEIITKLKEFKIKWDEISEGVKESVDSFSEVISIFTSIISSAKSLSDTFTDLEEIVVIKVDQIETAFKDIPAVIDEVISYLTRKSFTDIKEALKSVHAEWAKHKAVIDETMPSFNAAIDTISTLVSKVLSLSSAFVGLKDMSVLSVRDIDEAMKKIPEFLDHFVDALRLNMSGLKESLSGLNIEWAKHAEEMEDTMPSFTTATNDIGTLIGTILSLNSALEELRSMGVIREREFNRGFENLTKSIANFATSLATNVAALVFSLQKLRVVWVENEAVLLPLMKDFAIITDNLWGVAHNANRMAKEFSAITKNSKTLEKGFASLITFINQVVDGVKRFYTTEVAAEIARFIEDIGGVIASFVNLEIELKGAMGTIKKEIGGAVDNIKGRISSLSTLSASSFWWGVNMMKSFIAGIYAMSPALAIAVAAQAAIVHAFLGAASPTKLGPLSHLDEWPRNLIQSYSAGIESEMHTLNSSFAGLAPGMGAASPAGGNKTFHLHLTQNIGNRSDAMYSVDEIKRLMIRHEVM